MVGKIIYILYVSWRYPPSCLGIICKYTNSVKGCKGNINNINAGGPGGWYVANMLHNYSYRV